jgi:hypothetical protein
MPWSVRRARGSPVALTLTLCGSMSPGSCSGPRRCRSGCRRPGRRRCCQRLVGTVLSPTGTAVGLARPAVALATTVFAARGSMDERGMMAGGSMPGVSGPKSSTPPTRRKTVSSAAAATSWKSASAPVGFALTVSAAPWASTVLSTCWADRAVTSWAAAVLATASTVLGPSGCRAGWSHGGVTVDGVGRIDRRVDLDVRPDGEVRAGGSTCCRSPSRGASGAGVLAKQASAECARSGRDELPGVDVHERGAVGVGSVTPAARWASIWRWMAEWHRDLCRSLRTVDEKSLLRWCSLVE